MDQEVSVVAGIFSFFGWMVLLAFFVPWLAVMHAAYQKGVSVVSAAVVGFFGTPLLGFLYVIAHPADPVLRESRMGRSGKHRQCHSCMRVGPAAAMVCGHCGERFRGDASPEASHFGGTDLATHEPSPPSMDRAERSAAAIPYGMEAEETHYEPAPPDTRAAEEFRRRMSQRPDQGGGQR